MAPPGPTDTDALSRTANLTAFLAALTDTANRSPARDIEAKRSGAPEMVLWAEDFPPAHRLDPGADDVLLRLPPVRKTPAPAMPRQLADRLDPSAVDDPHGPEPELPPPPGESDEHRHLFSRWLAEWREWAQAEAAREPLRRLYDALEKAARALEQRDDEVECVLAVGLITWQAPDGTRLRRHLLVERLDPSIDKHATITVRRVPGHRRMEDRQLFEGRDDYRPDRAGEARDGILAAEAPPLSEETTAQLREWLGYALDRRWSEHAERPAEPGAAPVFSPSPALLLRPRDNALLAETYRGITEQLRAPGAQVPVGLAQLVCNTEPDQRAAWLREQGASAGDLLGTDPLFPRAANAEQSRVLELLRTETNVVVQGPPGTGKTHTIANLVSALLARGQRVLVTSQKDQALRVLRDKIPEQLRKLCVLLTGGSRDAAVELQQSLDALAQAVSTEDRKELARRRDALYAERAELSALSTRLNEQITAARTVELDEHPPVAPGWSREHYRGTLARIVREVQDRGGEHDWMPPLPQDAPDHPPLPAPELAELGDLLARHAGSPDRTDQEFPEPEQLPDPEQLAAHVEAERRAGAERTTDPTAAELARLPLEEVDELLALGEQADALLRRLGLLRTGEASRDWVARAVQDRLAGRHQGLWDDLLQVNDEPGRLQEQLRQQGLRFAVALPDITAANLGTARHWLNTGRGLLEHLRAGRRLRRRFPSKVQQQAADLLDAVRVDGRPPQDAEALAAALERIEAATAAAQLAHKWSVVGVTITAGELTLMLSELADNATALAAVAELGAVHQRFEQVLAGAGVRLPLHDLAEFERVRAALPAARRHREWQAARDAVTELHRCVQALAARPAACPELARLREAMSERDPDAYARGFKELEQARLQRAEQLRAASLHRTLSRVHPELARQWQQTCTDPAWKDRDIPAAWAWAFAKRFVEQRRTADDERDLLARFNSTEDRLKALTAELAAVEATLHCLAEMKDEHSRALHAYQAHMRKLGAGTGKKTREFRRASRTAMEKARDAVPAWVVPLPNLLENLAAHRDRFDVVIVDEASQVSIDHLYLLWMAPRVIAVGDDKQCTPGHGGQTLDKVFARAAEHLAGLDEDIQRLYTPKSNLYEVLTTRAGKDALIRLREHFRCVPEIITFSSQEFYQDGSGGSGLIPLRERPADGLEPLKVSYVDGARTEGNDIRLRNPVEAAEIVETLAACLRDESYAGKTFGVVVLRSTAKGHVQLLERLISERISPEDRQERRIRVGVPPDFQGDERDVVLLSLVVAGRAGRLGSGETYRQAYNVAASRAKDQMWLFSSLPLSAYPPGDLRTKLLEYVQDPPPVYGESPGLDEVPADEPVDGFDSLFEQRVYREIKRRGYHVVAQHPVGSRRLDLVVVGRGGRLAVECDGHHWHHGLRNERNDAQRDRELARMGWRPLRIRESEFELAPDRELARLWAELDRNDIRPEPDHTPTPNGAL